MNDSAGVCIDEMMSAFAIFRGRKPSLFARLSPDSRFCTEQVTPLHLLNTGAHAFRLFWVLGLANPAERVCGEA